MQGRKKYLKLVAFVPAIVLVGGYIGYRASAFERFTQPEPQPESQPVAAPQSTSETDPTYMPGSKFIRIELRPPGGTPTDPPAPGAPPSSAPPGKPGTFIYSSKSGPIELPIPTLTPGADGKPPAPNAPTPPQP